MLMRNLARVRIETQNFQKIWCIFCTENNINVKKQKNTIHLNLIEFLNLMQHNETLKWWAGVNQTNLYKLIDIRYFKFLKNRLPSNVPNKFNIFAFRDLENYFYQSKN